MVSVLIMSAAVPGDLPTIDRDTMEHFTNIINALTLEEQMHAQALAAELSPVEMRAWIHDLKSLSIEAGAARIRAVPFASASAKGTARILASLGTDLDPVLVGALGSAVTSLREGDRVAYVSGTPGAYADDYVMDAARVVKLPDSVSDRDAAALMLKGLTAWFLRTFGHTIPGMKNTNVDEIIQILDATGKSGAPLIINANDNEDGEHVQVYIG